MRESGQMERQEQSVREPEDLGSCVLKCLERGWGDRKGRIGKGGREREDRERGGQERGGR